MTAEFAKYKRLEELHKQAAKMLRYCGFKAIAKSDWANGNFRIKVNCTDSEIEEIKATGKLGDEIVIVNN